MIGSEAASAGVIGDVAKLLKRRLIVRVLQHSATIIERAEVIRARQAEPFAGWRFVHEGDELLTLAPADLVPKLISRDSELVPVA